MEEELLKKIKQIKANLENVKNELSNVQDSLNRTISINNNGFKYSEISNMKNRLNNQINNQCMKYQMYQMVCVLLLMNPLNLSMFLFRYNSICK